jgi:trehalose synthase
MAHIQEYIPVVGQSIIDELYLLAERLKGISIQTVNSTAVGGGVAEILNCMVPLINELGVEMYWDLIKGGESFFNVTKKFHNALHGKPETITNDMLEVFIETSLKNVETMKMNGDIIVIHDPQPIMLIKNKKKLPNAKWIWRCHIDVSNPDRKLWRFLKQFIMDYDGCIFSAPVFSQNLSDNESGKKVEQFLIPPSIDPLSTKNREIPQETIDAVLEKYEISRNKPIITQISRYDYLKDPIGVIEAYRLVKRYIDCQLMLVGNVASDDPEHDKVYSEVREQAKNDPDIHPLVIDPVHNDIEINALQRASDIILQKSIKEGFALTVTEALWKAKPVVASAVGGIPLQITNEYSGILTRTIEGTARAIRQIMQSPEYAKRLGENGREHIRNNFLITRHIRDYLLLFLSSFHDGDVVDLSFKGDG